MTAPMIDVLPVLIIIFMVITPLASTVITVGASISGSGRWPDFCSWQQGSRVSKDRVIDIAKGAGFQSVALTAVD